MLELAFYAKVGWKKYIEGSSFEPRKERQRGRLQPDA